MCGRIDKEINIWLVHMAGGSVLNGLIVRRCEGGEGGGGEGGTDTLGGGGRV